jgi:hypothetical protein
LRALGAAAPEVAAGVSAAFEAGADAACPLWSAGVPAGTLAAAVSSESLGFTCAMGRVRVTLSSPVSLISVAEVETTVPPTSVPSRMVTVARGPAGAWALLQELKNKIIRTVVTNKCRRIRIPPSHRWLASQV